MKSRTADFETSKKGNKQYVKAKQNSFSNKDHPGSKMNRRMKSEERTTSVYLNPSKGGKKQSKMYHDKSASNRIMFKQNFDDYIQANTSRKSKNGSKKGK